MIIRFLKWLFGRKKEEVVESAPQPKPPHCGSHNRYKKSCPACKEAVA